MELFYHQILKNVLKNLDIISNKHKFSIFLEDTQIKKEDSPSIASAQYLKSVIISTISSKKIDL